MGKLLTKLRNWRKSAHAVKTATTPHPTAKGRAAAPSGLVKCPKQGSTTLLGPAESYPARIVLAVCPTRSLGTFALLPTSTCGP